MPRYRFSWENFKPSLLKKLALSLKIEGAPAEGLQKRFGARPVGLDTDNSTALGIAVALAASWFGPWAF